MSIAFNIPDSIEQALRVRFGPGLETMAREALIGEAYRVGALGLGEVVDLLGFTTRFQAEAWLAARGIGSNLRPQDLDDDRATLASVLGTPRA